VTVTFTGNEAGTITDGTDTITFREIENIFLTDYDDSVDGSADNSGVNIFAYDGEDTVTGGSGADSITGGSGSDSLVGGAGSDTIDGGDHDDTVDGGDGNDDIDGGLGNDTIIGGAGADSILGGGGHDVIYSAEQSSFSVDVDQWGYDPSHNNDG